MINISVLSFQIPEVSLTDGSPLQSLLCNQTNWPVEAWGRWSLISSSYLLHQTWYLTQTDERLRSERVMLLQGEGIWETKWTTALVQLDLIQVAVLTRA